MNETPIRHDYTRGTRKCGWAIADFDFHAPGMATIAAFGMKPYIPNASDDTRHLLPGEEVVISMPDGDVLYEIVDIHYRSNPCDMYNATIRYIQHLTGLRIVSQRDAQQHARSLEWSNPKRPKE